MKTIHMLFAAILAGTLLVPAVARAAVTGPCVDCHTMHNSQDGARFPGAPEDDPKGHLTIKGCIGCHIGTGVTGAPIIDGQYNVDSTAGGTFKDGGAGGVVSDAGVHNVNVEGLLPTLGEDDALTAVIPGLTGGMNLGKGSSDPQDLTCAGKSGCHGDATQADNDSGIRGFHHGGKTGYRYLQIADTQAAVAGKGAVDWEKAISSSATGAGGEHNIYSSSTTVGINKLCANCHPNFHATANTQVGTNWVRHPTDNTIPGAGDGWAATVNYRENPFAFADISTLAPGTAYTTTNAQVACISCHRAHGTPYDDILRWDYSAQSAGSGIQAGCLGCHNKQR
ncbi:MAG: cytochrome c3 family protein [Thermodesulfobacteriota bacterium]